MRRFTVAATTSLFVGMSWAYGNGSAFAVETTSKASEAAPPPAAPPAAPPQGGGAVNAPPAAVASMPAAVPAQPTQGVLVTTASCKGAVASLRSGGAKSFEAMAADQRAAILQSPLAVDVLTCLASADNSPSYCTALPVEGKEYCTATTALARHLKAGTKEELRSQVLHFYCVRSGKPQAECDKGLRIMSSGDAEKCKELSNELEQKICAGLIKGDAKVCDQLTKPDDRTGCAIILTGDAKHCPKDSKSCLYNAGLMKAMSTKGLEGLQETDPALAAAHKGKEACTALLTAAERACQGQPASSVTLPPAAAAPAATPAKTVAPAKP